MNYVIIPTQISMGRGVANEWVASYSDQMSQIVFIDAVKSQPAPL